MSYNISYSSSLHVTTGMFSSEKEVKIFPAIKNYDNSLNKIYVSFDVEDIIWGMDRYEKQDMVDSLYDDGFVPSNVKKDLDLVIDRLPLTPLEQELSDLLDKVWNNRNVINNNDLEILKHLSKKGI